MKIANYLTETEKGRIQDICEELDSCRTSKEVDAYEYSLALLYEKALERYEEEQNNTKENRNG